MSRRGRATRVVTLDIGIGDRNRPVPISIVTITKIGALYRSVPLPSERPPRGSLSFHTGEEEAITPQENLLVQKSHLLYKKRPHPRGRDVPKTPVGRVLFRLPGFILPPHGKNRVFCRIGSKPFLWRILKPGETARCRNLIEPFSVKK